MTNEEYHHIPEQPDPTCPMLDKVVKELRDARSAIRRWEREYDPDVLREMIGTVERELFWGLNDAETQLERIRRHIEAIRTWGQAWKDLALAMEEENDK